jgi:hypothetical protein
MPAERPRLTLPREYTRTHLAGAVLAAVGLVLIVLALAGAFSGGSNDVGKVSAGTASTTSTESSTRWAHQGHVNYICKTGNRHLWNTTTRGGYSDSAPTP